jgi:hypothetical protein
MLPQVVKGDRKGHSGVIYCAVVLEDCLCGTALNAEGGGVEFCIDWADKWLLARSVRKRSP